MWSWSAPWYGDACMRLLYFGVTWLEAPESGYHATSLTDSGVATEANCENKDGAGLGFLKGAGANAEGYGEG